MLNSKNSLSFLIVTVTVVCAAAHSRRGDTVIRTHYEETVSYYRNPKCKPSRLDRGIECSDVGPTIEVQGGLYSNYELHYVPLASAYYVARIADALGYQNRCPTNVTFLGQLDIQTPWSGTRGAIAVALSYISILQGENLRWTLFVHCWRAKTPQNLWSEEIATSFNVFNLDPEFSAADRELVIQELDKRGFNTDPSNLIEFDYATTDCS